MREDSHTPTSHPPPGVPYVSPVLGNGLLSRMETCPVVIRLVPTGGIRVNSKTGTTKGRDFRPIDSTTETLVLFCGRQVRSLDLLGVGVEVNGYRGSDGLLNRVRRPHGSEPRT